MRLKSIIIIIVSIILLLASSGIFAKTIFSNKLVASNKYSNKNNLLGSNDNIIDHSIYEDINNWEIPKHNSNENHSKITKVKDMQITKVVDIEITKVVDIEIIKVEIKNL